MIKLSRTQFSRKGPFQIQVSQEDEGHLLQFEFYRFQFVIVLLRGFSGQQLDSNQFGLRNDAHLLNSTQDSSDKSMKLIGRTKSQRKNQSQISSAQIRKRQLHRLHQWWSTGASEGDRQHQCLSSGLTGLCSNDQSGEISVSLVTPVYHK